MHELSIAEAVIAIAERHARGRRVERIELRVGHLRQVVPAALDFAFELASQGTSLDGAELVMEEVPAAGRCRRCGVESVMTGFPLVCAGCGSFELDVLRGEELLVDALVLEDDQPAEVRT